MRTPDAIVQTPWDSRAFGMDTYEIIEVSEEVMEHAVKIPGHFTVKVDPLSSKRILHKYGFYYCDTLIVPYCAPENFRYHQHEGAGVSRDIDIEEATAIVRGAFVHGRFHRDFNIDSKLADQRYEQWLRQLYEFKTLFALVFENELAGFLGYTGNSIVLHALSASFRGKGLAKYLLSAAYEELFDMGNEELTSSVSAANAPIVNLYSSLGFRFRDPRDIYHMVVRR